MKKSNNFFNRLKIYFHSAYDFFSQVVLLNELKLILEIRYINSLNLHLCSLKKDNIINTDLILLRETVRLKEFNLNLLKTIEINPLQSKFLFTSSRRQKYKHNILVVLKNTDA